MVTEVPPVLGPEVGLTPVTVGAGGGGPVVMDTFWTWWMSLNPPVAPVNPTSTLDGSAVVVGEHLGAVHGHGDAGRRRCVTTKWCTVLRSDGIDELVVT